MRRSAKYKLLANKKYMTVENDGPKDIWAVFEYDEASLERIVQKAIRNKSRMAKCGAVRVKVLVEPTPPPNRGAK